jgi:hypothetical protein
MYSLTIDRQKTATVKRWVKDSKKHRFKGPAEVFLNIGCFGKSFFVHGIPYTFDKNFNILYRLNNGRYNSFDGEPSIIHFDKTKEWHKNGSLFELEHPNGTKEFYLDGRLHNYKGPAVVYPNGDKEYWIHGMRHRMNGPAVVYKKKKYWFKNGEFVRSLGCFTFFRV